MSNEFLDIRQVIEIAKLCKSIEINLTAVQLAEMMPSFMMLKENEKTQMVTEFVYNPDINVLKFKCKSDDFDICFNANLTHRIY